MIKSECRKFHASSFFSLLSLTSPDPPHPVQSNSFSITFDARIHLLWHATTMPQQPPAFEFASPLIVRQSQINPL